MLFQPPLLNKINWKHVSIEPSNFALYWLNCSKSHFYFKCEFPFPEDLCMNNSWRRIHQPKKFDTCKLYTHSKFSRSMNGTFISFPFINEVTYFNFVQNPALCHTLSRMVIWAKGTSDFACHTASFEPCKLLSIVLSLSFILV